MIIAVVLKSYKVYRKTNFVPISNGHCLSAFVGPNGAGKSSILEALDSFFNDSKWIINKEARKKGETNNFINLPFVCPVLLLKKDVVEDAFKSGRYKFDYCIIEDMSEYLWSVESGQVSSSSPSRKCIEFRDKLLSDDLRETHFLLIAGRRTGGFPDKCPTYFGPFHQQASFLKALGVTPSTNSKQLERSFENDAALAAVAGGIGDLVKSLYDYVYIPSDVNIAGYTKLETGTMQLLMGRSIKAEINAAISPETLSKVNQSLEDTVNRAVEGLDKYTYEKPIGGKKNITLPALARLVTREFFSIRELSLLDNSGIPTPVSNLSSGEQRRALVELASSYLTRVPGAHVRTVLAIDEPEISLHTGACYEQFEKLFGVARAGVQTLITTHWYGFLPIAQDGNAHFVDSSSQDGVAIDSYDLMNYKEKSRIKTRESKGDFPFDISLKSTNDLVQSIATSLRVPTSPYSWVLCEGSSEGIYLAHILGEEVLGGRLRILPLGGSGEVLKLYRHLRVALSDSGVQSSGHVLALIDTDEDGLGHDEQDLPGVLYFRRLLLSKQGGLELVQASSTRNAPATAIEDVLESESFLEVLSSYPGDLKLDLASVTRTSSDCSGLSLDLRTSEKSALDEFFGAPGRKVEFARKYAEVAAQGGRDEPLRKPILELLG